MSDEVTLAEAAPHAGAESEAFEATEITYKYDHGLEETIHHGRIGRRAVQRQVHVPHARLFRGRGFGVETERVSQQHGR